MKRSTIAEIVALFFVILFLYTAISKLITYPVTKEQIGLTPILAPVAGFIAITLPIAELITSIMLFLPLTRKLGMWATLALLVLFTGYIGYILLYDSHLPCTCGGVLEEMTWTQHLIFNFGCIFLSVWAILLQRLPGGARTMRASTAGFRNQERSVSKAHT